MLKTKPAEHNMAEPNPNPTLYLILGMGSLQYQVLPQKAFTNYQSVAIGLFPCTTRIEAVPVCTYVQLTRIPMTTGHVESYPII